MKRPSRKPAARRPRETAPEDAPTCPEHGTALERNPEDLADACAFYCAACEEEDAERVAGPPEDEDAPAQTAPEDAPAQTAPEDAPEEFRRDSQARDSRIR